MVPFKRSIFDLFDGKKRYEVPLFQRQYVWSRDVQWEPLWEDMVHKFRQRLAGIEGAKHFLGAAVLEQKKIFGNQVPTQVLIDGQQRLTTFQIFLAAFRDCVAAFAAAEKDPEIAMQLVQRKEEIHRHIINDKSMADPEVERFKVWPTYSDQRQFVEVITAGSLTELEKKHPLIIRRKKVQARPRMVEAYVFFSGKMTAFLKDAEIKATVPEKADAAFFALRDDLQIVTIDLEQADDAQVIYETLNARGEPLLHSDLLRNFVFLRAGQAKNGQKSEDVHHLYNTLWIEFENAFWRADERQGRLVRRRIDVFVQLFVMVKTGREVTVRNLFVDYKGWVVRAQPFKTVQAELEELVRYRNFFKLLVSPTKGDPSFALARRLIRFDSKTLYPVLLWIMGEVPSPEEQTKMFRLLDSYIVRRAVCGLTTKAYNRVFLSVLSQLVAGERTAKHLASVLSDLSGDTEVFPSDEMFHRAWHTLPAYSVLGPSMVEDILRSIDESLYQKKSEVVEVKSFLTVEHVMPVAWLEHWPLTTGAKGMPLGERYLNSETEEARLSNTRDAVLHRFGNLTLLTSPLNISVSNGPFSTKAPAITEQSLLRLNSYFQRIEKWDETGIQNRAEHLFSHAKHVWPHVSASAAAL